jgi:hypothetical protein
MIQTDELQIKDSPRHALLRFVLLAPTASPTTVIGLQLQASKQAIEKSKWEGQERR